MGSQEAIGPMDGAAFYMGEMGMGREYTILEEYDGGLLVGFRWRVFGLGAPLTIKHEGKTYERGMIQAFDADRNRYMGIFCSLREYIQKGTDQ